MPSFQKGRIVSILLLITIINNINNNDNNEKNNDNNSNNKNNSNDILREFVVDSRHPGDTHACWVRVRPAVADT